MADRARVGHGDGMTHPQAPSPSQPPGASAGLRLIQADFDALVRELDDLRCKHRIELEQRLRDARDFGSPADNDDVLTVFEDIAIDQSRISRLEEAVRSAVIVPDGAFDGTAGPGCVIEVDDGRRRQSYHLVGRRTPEADRHVVSTASPVGKALVGSRAGDVAHASLPDGRTRRLAVVSVSAPVMDDAVAFLRDDAAA
jgi:transcription elongation factor GreA